MRNYRLNAAMLLTFLFASCAESTILVEPTAEHSKKCDNRSLEQIVQIAQNAPMTFEGKVKTRNGLTLKKELDLSSITGITNQGKTRTSGEIDTLLYAINYADNDGYVIVSSKKGTPGVIAYVEEGEYDIEKINDSNTDIGYVADLAVTYIDNSEEKLVPTPVVELDTTISMVGPLILTKWGQHGAEGIYCPNGVSGCTNTAMAQIFAYYEYPDTLQLTYDDADRSYQVFDWGNMKKHIISHPTANYMCLADTECHNAIGRLCRQLGQLNYSTYGAGVTTTQRSRIRMTASSLGYTCSFLKAYNDTCTVEPLQNGHPLIVGGNRSNGDGHIWIVDGYMEMTITTTEYTVDQDSIISTEKELYNHVNWGWDGKDNGYILSSIFDSSNMYLRDPSIYGSNTDVYNYERNIQYIEMYRPDTNNSTNQ